MGLGVILHARRLSMSEELHFECLADTKESVYLSQQQKLSFSFILILVSLLENKSPWCTLQFILPFQVVVAPTVFD